MSTVISIEDGIYKGAAVLWMKNGDHPLDYSVDPRGPDAATIDIAKREKWEGKVVRYFRHPDHPGHDVCKECGKPYHLHGWIDDSRYSVIDTLVTTTCGVVCPGTWILNYDTRDSSDYWLCNQAYFETTVFHVESMKNKVYASNFKIKQTMPSPPSTSLAVSA